MDRIRAGLTGLGAVFLVTAAASLIYAPDPAERAAAELAKEPGEPLAQLGVAPNSEKEEGPAAPAAEARPSLAPATKAPPGRSPVDTAPMATPLGERPVAI